MAFAAGAPEQQMCHGFLAVDFFLVLSGFVMGYAYDDRWTSMSVGGFFRRRLIRLHPMIVMGVVIGLAVFICQGAERWDGTHVTASVLMLITLLALFLIPSPYFAGCPWQYGDVSAEWSQLVPVLRVHREHPVCSDAPPALHRVVEGMGGSSSRALTASTERVISYIGNLSDPIAYFSLTGDA